MAIGYAFRPRLRSRLTLSRRTLLRKPWTIGGGDSHPSFVTHAGILTSRTSTAGLRRRFAGARTLSYRVRIPKDRTPAASVTSLSPVEFSALDHLTSELLRILSRMAASKPTSWLSVQSNIVSHLASTWGPYLAVWAVPLLTTKFIPRRLTARVHVVVFGVCLKSVTW